MIWKIMNKKSSKSVRGQLDSDFSYAIKGGRVVESSQKIRTIFDTSRQIRINGHGTLIHFLY